MVRPIVYGLVTRDPEGDVSLNVAPRAGPAAGSPDILFPLGC